MTEKQKAALKAMIRPMIKEEVKKVIAQVVPSLLAESLTDVLPLVLSEIVGDQPMKLTEVVSKSAGVPNRPAHSIKFSDNPVLDQILRNTQGGVPQETAPAHYMNAPMPQIMPDAYSSEQEFNEDYGPMETYEPQHVNPAAIQQLQAKMGSIIPETNSNGAPTNISAEQLADVAPEVFSAITKDYRGLMKAMDAKKNAGESNIDFSKLPPSNALR